MKKFSLVSVLLIFSAFLFSQGTLLQFKYTKDLTTRILSNVDEAVYINGTFLHNTKILNRIFCKITEVDEKGSGKYEASFMTSETATANGGKSFSWGNKYESLFTRDKTGKYTISDDYFMPVVRDVPLFPNHKVKVGDKWTGEGQEAHDLRNTFNINTPYKVPFTANYTYLKDEKDKDGEAIFNVIGVEYQLYYKSPTLAEGAAEANTPLITQGFSNQTIYWDNEKGSIDHYNEEFDIMIQTVGGDKITFKGTATAKVSQTEQVNTAENLKKISESVQDMGLQNIDVKKSDKGIIISVENIQFEADSSVLLESEKQKLRNIANILKTYKNDLLITGYCANIGSQESQKVLSEERAASVAEYLALLKVRTPSAIFTEGKGSKNPLASDATAEGRAKNRRVEITIIDE